MNCLIRWLRSRALTLAWGAAATAIITAAAPIAPAGADSPDEDMIGQIRFHTAAHEDTLLDIARDNALGYVEIIAANPGVDPWVPGEGTDVVLPTGHLLPDAPREGLVINLAEHRLYYFETAGQAPITYPVGVGRAGWETPLGTTEVVRKQKNPAWFPPASIKEEDPELPDRVPPGPDNPLGHRALYFDWPGFLIHGTNMPWGIGRRVSHGCLRLYPENIESLFDMVGVGTPVRVIAQFTKVGWHEGDLYLEAHPEPEQVDELEETGRFETLANQAAADIYFKIRERAGSDITRINWPAVRSALTERSGVPVRITRVTKTG